MKIEFDSYRATIWREPGDRKIYSESHWYYLVTKQLQAMGYPVIKKLMHKDGHLVDSEQYYIRNRNPQSAEPFYALVDHYYSVRPIYQTYNQCGNVTLQIEK